MDDFYVSHSRFSDPGPHADWLAATPADLAALREAATQLVFHYWGSGPITDHGFPAARNDEITLRYAADMWARLRELNPAPPGAPRAPLQRIVGCCRDFTLLLVSMARHHGIPARVRVGVASYLIPGWYIDHVVAEIRTADGWRLVEAQMPPGFRDPVDDVEFDLLDVPRDRFLTGPAAWIAARAGEIDPARVVVNPDLDVPFLRGFPYAWHNVVLDLAALNKHEMLLWDVWGAIDDTVELAPATLARADELAELMTGGDVEQLRTAFEADDVRVPPVIHTVTPPGLLPVEVALR
ncbi:transglutaminase-like domain-containing protein [Amycolatopsis tolypomycina]|uniref:Transglutaminase-like superfamily protein n=1 Tax=Amycolatopsis tolypomycina TaxID=208445 RepID=A0A1H4IIA0_9PSEU|nr:transglutaminase-like domain-containing protein [Amycolatopsis tolypomycina]SEB33643.1 Transglutaminase-like superfamily protein [Amycolatopsis tolypomycina]